MTWLLTNDDGIDAPGLRALAQALPDHLDEDIVVVAPMQEQSGCGHQTTTGHPIAIKEVDASPFERVRRAYAIAGTPADCVRVAIHYLNLDLTFVCSGINAGGNLGVDIYMSGTVAAVREAAFYGISGIALSQYRRGPVSIDWPRTAGLARHAIAHLLKHPLAEKQFWNVNLPHPDPCIPQPEIILTTSCTQPMPCRFEEQNGQLLFRGDYSGRPQLSGTDIATCFGGHIATTQITV